MNKVEIIYQLDLSSKQGENIGTDRELINEDAELSDFYIDENLRDNGQDINEQKEIETVEELNSDSNQVEYHDDQEEDIIPPEEASNLEDITTVYDEFDSRNKELTCDSSTVQIADNKNYQLVIR